MTIMERRQAVRDATGYEVEEIAMALVNQESMENRALLSWVVAQVGGEEQASEWFGEVWAIVDALTVRIDHSA